MSNTKHITDLPEVFAIFGSNVKLADVLNVGPSTVSEMKRRKSIPVEYWPALVSAATEIGENDLTLERLAIISAEAAIERSKEREHAA
jgi:DNA-binding transcriptional regulator YdaS (Cro superfamily)